MATPPSASSLLPRALLRLVLGVLSIGALIFGPAGSWGFWPGWLYLGALFGPMLGGLTWMLTQAPELLEARLRMREPRSAQRRVIGLSNAFFLAVILLPGLDWRLRGAPLPPALIVAANVGVVACYGFILWVFRVNHWASRVIEVQEGQQVISTGPYAWVRHPMYSGMVALMFCTPLALGSAWALLPALAVPPLLAARIQDEEAALVEGLPGYAEYRARVRWRLLPGVW